jgi:hypothetical protein
MNRPGSEQTIPANTPFASTCIAADVSEINSTCQRNDADLTV